MSARLCLSFILCAGLCRTVLAQPAGQEGGQSRLELALGGGVNSPFGPASVSIAYLPIRHLALGLGLGYAVEPLWASNKGHFRPGALVRGYLLDSPHLRLGLGLSLVNGDYIRHASGQATDGTPVALSWGFEDVTRVDGGALVEVARGDFALRLEVGAGRVFGDPPCYARFPSGVSTSCTGDGSWPPVPHGAPPRWVPSAQLALALRAGNAPAPAGGTAFAPRKQLRLALTATTARVTDFISDGNYTDASSFDTGVEGDLRVALGTHVRVGAGARYAIGTGENGGHVDSEHLIFFPGLAGAHWRSARTGEEVEAAFGVGPALGAFVQRRTAVALGVGAELGVSYLRPLSDRLWLVVGLSARFLFLEVQNGSSSLEGRSGIHFEAPARIGLCWGL